MVYATMKVLLLGEYSGVHTELSNELRRRGICVKTISDGDGYKDFPSDIIVKIQTRTSKNIFYKIYRFVLELIGLNGIVSFGRIFKSIKNDLKGYDIVQLINPVALSGFGSLVNIFLLRYLKKNNNKIFLCALGDDFYWVSDCLKGNSKYVALNKVNLFNFYKEFYSTKYKYALFYKLLNNYAVKTSHKIIPGLYDYQRVYNWCEKTSNLVPLPISSNKIGKPIKLNESDKIIIFHGWQKGKESRKGNLLFDKVAKRICLDYPEKVLYRVVQNVPFNEYVNLIKESHIAFDQCFSYDKGVNGLLYMADGKVTFTGMESEALNNYPFSDSEKLYGINAKADEEYLYDKISFLINNPTQIEIISKNAIDFVIKNHDSKIVLDLYLNIWTN